ncbi:aspartic proteinase nepenthesin-2 [Amborella trichopoda]|uniref:aspartic proteinase nepenthesin-2 n=1 Tax=Amborella trichopoda TaxID=13333 RepID=UPI0005D371EA|nr:aspartic proteinase nepenthesin-2 [Amborella trichopoda]|eukprot:XP_011620449.1 aspartic proteinase nepenthesin-2 [Amborella trichopoda]
MERFDKHSIDLHHPSVKMDGSSLAWIQTSNPMAPATELEASMRPRFYESSANPGYNSSASTNRLSSPCKTSVDPHYNSSATTNPRSSHSFAVTNPGSSTNMSSDSTPNTKNDTTPSASTTSTSPSVNVIQTNNAIQKVLNGIGFGCGHNNTGNFLAAMAGIKGLGGGPLSLASQLGGVTADKFSYCLTFGIAIDAIGQLISRDNPVIDGPNTKRTEIIRDPDMPTFHFLNLEGISAGDKRLTVPPGTFDQDADGNGGLMIDSGDHKLLGKWRIWTTN